MINPELLSSATHFADAIGGVQVALAGGEDSMLGIFILGFSKTVALILNLF